MLHQIFNRSMHHLDQRLRPKPEEQHHCGQVGGAKGLADPFQATGLQRCLLCHCLGLLARPDQLDPDAAWLKDHHVFARAIAD